MFEQVGTRNTRLITEAIIQARISHEEWQPEDNFIPSWKVREAFNEAAPSLEIPKTLIIFVNHLLSMTHHLDWDGQSKINGRSRIMVWPSNKYLADVFGKTERNIQFSIRDGQELGLFEMVDSPSGKRYGTRGEDDRPLSAYGFDLSPLAARYQEFKKIVDDRKKLFREKEHWRNHIMSTRNKILSLLSFARNSSANGDWDHIEEEARKITTLRDKADLPQLRKILLSLSEMKASLEEKIQTLLREKEAETPSVDSKEEKIPSVLEETSSVKPFDDESIVFSPMGEKNRHPHKNTYKNLYKETKGFVVKNEKTNPSKPTQTQTKIASALRDLVLTPKHITQIAPIFLEHMPNTKYPLWEDALNAAKSIRSALGISKNAWIDACTSLGTTEAVAAIAIIATRYEKQQIKSPGGTLRRMIERNHANELRLDLSVYKLLKEAKTKTVDIVPKDLNPAQSTDIVPEQPLITIDNTKNHELKNHSTDQKSQQKESALRDLVLTPKHITQIAPIFLEHMPNTKYPLWEDALNAAKYVLSTLKISPRTWKDAHTSLGITEAVTATAVIAARYEKKEICSPDLTLRHMIQLNHTNELRLDLSVYKLLKEAKKTTKPVVTIDVTKKHEQNYSTDKESPKKEIVNIQPFPNSGGIDFNEYWKTIKRETRCNMDNTMIADKFRSFCQKNNISLNSKSINQIFKNFCNKISTI